MAKSGGRDRQPRTHTRGRADWADEFIRNFTELSTITAACEATDIGRQTFYDRKERDPDFAARFEAADEALTDTFREEARRRAIDGVERPVFQGGEKVGTVTEYSDRMLEGLLRARDPAWRTSRVDVHDDREQKRRREIERLTDTELDNELTGIDNVVDIASKRKAS